MRNKMITLDPTSYEIAQKMPNFSAWVRRMLIATDSGETLDAAIKQRQFWKDRHDAVLEELEALKNE